MPTIPITVYNFGFSTSQDDEFFTPAKKIDAGTYTTGNGTVHGGDFATGLALLPAGKKFIIIGIGPGYSTVDVFKRLWLHDGTGNRADIVDLITNGEDNAEGIAYWDAVWDKIILDGEDMNGIILDVEYGTMASWRRTGTEMFSNTGADRQTKMQSIIDDAGANAQLPEWLKTAMTISDFNANFADETNATMIAWNQWAFWRDSLALKTMLKDTAEAKFGHDVQVWNWRETVMSWQAYDNSSKANGTAAVENVCAWPIYMSNGVSGTYNGSPTKKGRWNHMITSLNQYRSCLSAGGVAVPWVGLPFYNGGSPSLEASFAENPWLWKEMVKHLYAMGIETYNLFTRDSMPFYVEQEQVAVDHFKTLDPTTIQPTVLSEIAIDADSITTGNVTTVYDADNI